MKKSKKKKQKSLNDFKFGTLIRRFEVSDGAGSVAVRGLNEVNQTNARQCPPTDAVLLCFQSCSWPEAKSGPRSARALETRVDNEMRISRFPLTSIYYSVVGVG